MDAAASTCTRARSRSSVRKARGSSRSGRGERPPYYTEPERAALALAEAATRLSDRTDAVPDEVWKEASRHFSEPELGALVMTIAIANFWNRLNVPTRHATGGWIAQYI